MNALPLWLLLVIFVVAAAVTWMAGVQLSRQTDVLASRLHLGQALGGTILLAVATNLPEIAITVSAAITGNLSVAIGNILGGIALQTVVLVIIDAFGVRGDEPLTYRAASLSLVVEAGIVIAVLGIAIMGTQLPQQLILFRIPPAGILIAAAWVVGLMLTNRAGRSLPWHENGDAPGGQDEPQGHSRGKSGQQGSTAKAAIIFAVAAVATLVAGAALEMSGDAASGQIGLSGILFGATVLALATSLPEISTGLTSARGKDYKLAMSDIFGGNAFLPVLFLVATLISGKSALPQAHGTDVYLTAIAIVLTLVYLLGILFRPRKRILRMGVDSFVVLVLYLLGIAGLFAIAASS